MLGVLSLTGAVVAGLVAYAVTPRPGSTIGTAASTQQPNVQQSGPGAGLPKLASGRPAPRFDLPRLGGGRPVSLAGEASHPVVLNFFASWCSDCRAELSSFATVSSNAPSGVRFLGIDTNDHSPKKAEALLRAAGDNYPVGVDPNAAVANGRYLIQALPVTIFISSSQHIVGEAFGTQSVRSLRHWINQLTRNKSS